jgi:ketosteroid isomerase-like protein
VAIDAVAIVRGMHEAYARRDLGDVLTYLADDIVFALHIDRDLAPFGGVSIGKAAVVRRCSMILQQFDMLDYSVVSLSIEGDEARALISFHYRHQASGEDIEGHMRHVMWLRDGSIARLNEYHDRARVEAFLRLVSCDPIRTNEPELDD